MSETNPDPSPDAAARAPSPTPSDRSITSNASTASSRLPKPTGMRPPTAVIKKPSTSVSSTPATPVTTRIGRICTAHGHGAKAGPPPLELHKSKYFHNIFSAKQLYFLSHNCTSLLCKKVLPCRQITCVVVVLDEVKLKIVRRMLQGICFFLLQNLL